MSNTENDIAAIDITDDNEVINYVQRERLSLYATGQDIPVKLRIELLNGLSKTALDKRKVNANINSSNADIALAKALEIALANVRSNGNPFITEGGGTIPEPDLPLVVLLPGEGDIGLVNIDIDEFIQENSPK